METEREEEEEEGVGQKKGVEPRQGSIERQRS
jgi:hypothetical protein